MSSRLHTRLVLGAVALLATSLAGRASAQTFDHAHVIVTNPFAPGNVLYPYAESTRSGTMSFTRQAQGVYSVAFPGHDSFATNLHPIAQANGIASNHCQVGTVGDIVGGSGGVFVKVFCFGVNGLPVDNSFTVSIDRIVGNSASIRGYAHGDGNFATGTTFTLTAAESYNSSGGAVTFKQWGTGSYEARFESQTHADCSVAGTMRPVPIVGTYGGATDGRHCEGNLFSTGTGYNSVRIYCVNAAGQAVNTKWAVALSSLQGPSGIAQTWDDTSTTAVDRACHGGTVTSMSTTSHPSTGRYIHSGTAFSGAAAGGLQPYAFVSTYSGPWGFCKVASTTSTGARVCSNPSTPAYETTTQDIRCFDNVGTPTDFRHWTSSYGDLQWACF